MVLLVCGVMGMWAGRAAAQAAGPERGAMKVAIICRDDGGAAKSEQVTAILTAGLSHSEEFSLVEREAVRKVIAEQALQIAGDAAGAVKAGNLMGANLLLLVQLAKEDRGLLRVQLVETAGGVILLDQVERLEAMTTKAEDFRQVVEGLARKAAVPVPDRKLVGLIGVSSGEPGRSLDTLTTSLEVLLRTGLAASPRVVMLEREQLQHLVAERGLSGMDVKLRGSARLLDLRVKRAEGAGDAVAKDQLEIAVRVRDMGGRNEKTVQLVLPGKDLAALRRALVPEVLKALEVLEGGLPAQAAGDVREEAFAFAERAQVMRLGGREKSALSLALTAYSLDPRPDYLRLLTQICDSIFNRTSPSLGSHFSIIRPHRRNAEQLSAALLMAELHLDASRRVLTNLPAEMPDSSSMQWGPGRGADLSSLQPMFPLADPPVTVEDKLVAEILERKREDYELWMGAYRRRKWSTRQFRQGYMYLQSFLSRDGADFRKRMQAIFEEYERGEPEGVQAPSQGNACPDIGIVFFGSAWSGYLGNVELEESRPLLKWLMERPEPLLRIQGLNALIRLDDRKEDDRIFQVMDMLFRGKTGKDFKPEWKFPLHISVTATRVKNNPKRIAYAMGLLEELEKSGDVLPLLRWTYESEILYYSPEAKDRLAAAERMQKLLQGKVVPDIYVKQLRMLEGDLGRTIKYAKKDAGLADSKGNPWDDFTIRAVDFGKPPARAPKLIWASLDRSQSEPDILMLWRSDPMNEKEGRAEFELVVGRMPLKGGRITEVARGRLPGPVGREHGELLGFQVTSVVATPAGIFIGDLGRGVIVARDEKLMEWTEKEGLSSNRIWSLGWGAGTLYAGADDGFISIDPRSGKCRTLGSANAMKSLNPLDGGTPYRVGNILPAPDGKSLWLSIGADTSRVGLWRYDLASGTYEHVVHVPDKSKPVKDPGPSLTWHEGKLLVLGVDRGMEGLHDANTGAMLRPFRGPGLYSLHLMGATYTERSTADVWVASSHTMHRRVALTPLGFVRHHGVLVDLFGEEASLWKSKIVKPEMQRDWQVIEEVGGGFFAASYWDSIDRPQMYFISPPPGLSGDPPNGR
jgi:hypothetical protein